MPRQCSSLKMNVFVDLHTVCSSYNPFVRNDTSTAVFSQKVASALNQNLPRPGMRIRFIASNNSSSYRCFGRNTAIRFYNKMLLVHVVTCGRFNSMDSEKCRRPNAQKFIQNVSQWNLGLFLIFHISKVSSVIVTSIQW